MNNPICQTDEVKVHVRPEVARRTERIIATLDEAYKELRKCANKGPT